MAVSTGGSVLHDENGLNKLEDVNMEQLGSAKEVVITKDDTLIMKVSLWLRLSHYTISDNCPSIED